MRLVLALLLGFALSPGVSGAQQASISPSTPASPIAAAPPRSMRAARRTTPIVIDGRLDDPAWAMAEPSGAMVQSYPKPGAAAPPSFTVAQPNFNVRSLRGNAVVRWDYRPGSSVYLVWQQQRSGFAPIGDFDGRRDVGAIFRTVPTNVFLVKATYWIGK
jgi:hypothetical protein